MRDVDGRPPAKVAAVTGLTAEHQRDVLNRARELPGLLSQAVFELRPLWLVAMAAPAVLYGPYWAVLVFTLGIGGLLIGQWHLKRRLTLAF